MIITTIQDVPGMEIVEYRGLVTGEVVAGINVVKDIGAGLRNLFGGRTDLIPFDSILSLDTFNASARTVVSTSNIKQPWCIILPERTIGLVLIEINKNGIPSEVIPAKVFAYSNISSVDPNAYISGSRNI